jgi:type IV secretion system protein VirB1
MDMEINLDNYIKACTYDVSAKTIAVIVEVESERNPWVINDNTTKKSYKFISKEEAVAKAEELITQGNNIDLGLAQINSYNLPKLNLTAGQVLEPCTNLKAGSTILKGFYFQAKERFSDNQQALFHALSAYNTGSLYNGYEYASKVWRRVAWR